MDYINVVSKEAVTAVPTWIAFAGGIVPILLVLSTFIYWAIVKDLNKVVKYLFTTGVIAVIVAIAWACISCSFFSEPTGKFRYTGTINKEVCTIQQYEDFIATYHPTIDKNKNIYYWED